MFKPQSDSKLQFPIVLVFSLPWLIHALPIASMFTSLSINYITSRNPMSQFVLSKLMIVEIKSLLKQLEIIYLYLTDEMTFSRFPVQKSIRSIETRTIVLC